MRRFDSLRLTLTLSTLVLGALPLAGCGYQTWSEPPFTTGTNPNQPEGSSENMQRVMGKPVQTSALTTEPGDIWPGPLPPTLTLQDLERNGSLTPGVEQPVPGSPDARGMSFQHSVPAQQPAPARGSSTPPGSTQPGLNTPAVPPTGAPSATVNPPATGGGPGQVYQTPRGAAMTTGGGPGYQTTVTPGGGSAIVVPNGNGTSTVIYSDGRIETVTTPK